MGLYWRPTNARMASWVLQEIWNVMVLVIFGVKMHMGSQFFIFFWLSSRFLQNPIFCVGILKKIKENIKKHKNSIFWFRSQDAHGFLNFLYFFGFLHDFCKIQYFVWKSWRKSRKIIKTWKLHFWIRWWHLCPDPNFQNHQTPDSASWLLLFTSPLLTRKTIIISENLNYWNW